MIANKTGRCLTLCATLSLTNACGAVPAQCPTLPEPAPLAERVYIRLTPGRIEVDAGGEKLLRDYAGLRARIRALWGAY